MKKGTDTERREGQQQQTKQGQGAGAEKEFRSNILKKERELLGLSLDFLFPDSPYGLFCCENFHGEKKKLNQQSWNQKVSCMPFTARLTFEKALVMR